MSNQFLSQVLSNLCSTLPCLTIYLCSLSYLRFYPDFGWLWRRALRQNVCQCNAIYVVKMYFEIEADRPECSCMLLCVCVAWDPKINVPWSVHYVDRWWYSSSKKGQDHRQFSTFRWDASQMMVYVKELSMQKLLRPSFWRRPRSLNHYCPGPCGTRHFWPQSMMLPT